MPPRKETFPTREAGTQFDSPSKAAVTAAKQLIKTWATWGAGRLCFLYLTIHLPSPRVAHRRVPLKADCYSLGLPADLPRVARLPANDGCCADLPAGPLATGDKLRPLRPKPRGTSRGQNISFAAVAPTRFSFNRGCSDQLHVRDHIDQRRPGVSDGPLQRA
jgi:hypothetical protein